MAKLGDDYPSQPELDVLNPRVQRAQVWGEVEPPTSVGAWAGSLDSDLGTGVFRSERGAARSEIRWERPGVTGVPSGGLCREVAVWKYELALHALYELEGTPETNIPDLLCDREPRIGQRERRCT